jgi:outer membrane protein assembly factor BamD (BamD/ComL family)
VGPADLFETASEARRRGDYGQVLDVDRDLEARYPTSREAQVLRAIVGRVLLDRGDPTGALARFESYLAAGGGDLSEEALLGKATAFDRLGRNDEAARAWSALVAAFPDTPYAAHAKARLETLNGR